MIKKEIGYAYNNKYLIKTMYGWDDFSGVSYLGKKRGRKIVFDSGEYIISTYEHKFISNTEKVLCSDIKVGQYLDSHSSRKRIIYIEEDVAVDAYDILNVQNEKHTFTAKPVESINCDELAFVSHRIANAFWTSIFPVLSTGGKCIITSTPSDDESLFADIWKKATNTLDKFGNEHPEGLGQNGFSALRVPWHEHPDRGDEYKEEQIMAYGEEMFRREHELEFISEQETIIDPLKTPLLNNKKLEPIAKTGQVRWYKKLDPSKIYLIGYDPSLGTGRDNSCIEIFEFPSMEQVGEWSHNRSDVPTQVMTLKKILQLFEEAGFDEDNVYWTLENNSVGEAPIVLIQEYGEDEFFGTLVSEPIKTRPAGSRSRKGMTTTPSSKLEACSRLKSWVENDKMTLRSSLIVSEIKTFARRGRSWAALPGCHDDSVTAALLVIRIANKLIKDEDEYMEELGINDSILDDDEGWGMPMPVVV